MLKHTCLLMLCVSLLLPSALAMDIYYNVTMTYDKGNVSLDSISVTPLAEYDSEYYKSMNDYIAIVSDESKVLDSYGFDFNLALHGVKMMNGELVSEDTLLEKNTVSEYFPYNEEATKIIVADTKTDELLQIDLKPVEEKPETQAVQQPQEKQKLPLNYILIAVLAIAILVIVILILPKKNQD